MLERVNQPVQAKTNSSPMSMGCLLQRKCACGQHTGNGGECAECRKKRLDLQRMAVNQSEPQTVPPIVHEVLRSPGRPLDPATHNFFEPRFGYDFGHVRVHTDAKAAESAQSVNALAYTVSDDIAFGAGQFSPTTNAGKQLLAHELAHTIQQNRQKQALALEMTPPHTYAEQEAKAAAYAILQGGVFHTAHAAPRQLARQGKPTTTQTTTPATTTAPSAATPPTTRTKFDQIMKNRYQVTTIRTGTFQNQAFGNMKQDDWKTWDPGSSSEVYTWIIEAFANFEKTFSGLPAVKEIVFFEANYRRGAQGEPVKDTTVGASYGLGQLMIYQAGQQGNRMFNLQGVLESPTSEQAVKRNITHELGHGIAETALPQANQPPGADPHLFEDYRRTVGWTQDEKLYDIQEKVVQDAFKNRTPPPPQFQIKPGNVDTKPWKERPLTRYMADNPGDDFAEAIMTYVNEPQRLKALSSTRYNFIDKRKARWLASGQPKVNIWEQVRQGGPARTLKPSRRPTIWERVREAK